MIEIIQDERQKASGKREQLHNIRQVGSPGGRVEIYLEDYVHTYLKNSQREQAASIGVLLGKREEDQDQVSLFISGAVGLESEESSSGKMMQKETWEQLYKVMRQYFPDLVVMGWYQIEQKQNYMVSQEEAWISQNYFKGPDHLRYLAEWEPGEESFYLWQNGELVKKNGYYIYYEKNPQMQEYMVQNQKPKHWVEKEPIPERQKGKLPKDGLESYRREYQKRTQHGANSRWRSVSNLIAGTMAIGAVLLGVTMLNSVEKLQQVEQTLAGILQQQDNPDIWAGQAIQTRDEEQDAQQGTKEDVQKEKVGSGDNSKKDIREDDIVEVEKVSGEIEPEKKKKKGEPTEQNKQQFYEVQKGDSLDKICEKLYHSTEQKQKICQINQIQNADQLKIGQKIQLP